MLPPSWSASCAQWLCFGGSSTLSCIGYLSMLIFSISSNAVHIIFDIYSIFLDDYFSEHGMSRVAGRGRKLAVRDYGERNWTRGKHLIELDLYVVKIVNLEFILLHLVITGKTSLFIIKFNPLSGMSVGMCMFNAQQHKSVYKESKCMRVNVNGKEGKLSCYGFTNLYFLVVQ